MIHIVLWKWKQANFRSSYTSHHANVMAAMIRRYGRGLKYRIVLVTDDPTGVSDDIDVHPLWKDWGDSNNASGAHLPSCYRRLKIFDPATQAEMGIAPGDRICSIDLDTVIVGELAPLLGRKDRFVGWARRGTKHLRVFNGSLFLFTAGDLAEIWTEFTADSPRVANKHGYFGSDQSWISYRLSKKHDCAGFNYPQVLSYPQEVARRPAVPRNASIIFFHGRRKPWDADVQRESKWITKYWRLDELPKTETHDVNDQALRSLRA